MWDFNSKSVISDKVISGMQLKTTLPRFLLLLALPLYSLTTLPLLYAWNSDAHRQIVYAASHSTAYPDDLKTFLRKNGGLIADFSVKPDLEEKGPAAEHSFKICAAKIKDLQRRILAGSKGKVVAENLGRISHYLADINHPLKTEDLDEEGKKIYLRYEADRAATKAIEYEMGLNPPQHLENIDASVEKMSQEANLGYRTILKLYATPQPQFQELLPLTQSRITAAVQATMDVWFTLWQLKETEPLKEQVSANPSADGFLRLIDLYTKQNRKGAAEEIFRQAYSQLGETEQLMHAEIKFYFSRKDFSRAAEIAKSALKKNPGALKFRYTLAVVYSRWAQQGGDKTESLKEKAMAEWTALLGTEFGKTAQEQIEKLKAPR